MGVEEGRPRTCEFFRGHAQNPAVDALPVASFRTWANHHRRQITKCLRDVRKLVARAWNQVNLDLGGRQPGCGWLRLSQVEPPPAFVRKTPSTIAGCTARGTIGCHLIYGFTRAGTISRR
jgi:hypothetical protein